MQRLDYMTPPFRKRGWWMRYWRPVILVVAVLFLISILISVEVSTDRVWICSACGSRRSEIEWIGGFKSGQSVATSTLDTWISRNAGGHQHEWCSIRGTSRNILGLKMAYAHGSAPPILRFPFDAQLIYMKSATTQQIAAFVQTMQSGTDAQQRQAVDQAANQAIDGMAAGASTMPSVDPLKR